MKQKLPLLLSTIVTASMLIGCGGSDSNIDQEDLSKIYKLTQQSGTGNYLFYGETNHKSLGSLNTLTVIDGNHTTVTLVESNISVQVPVPSTAIGTYNTEGSYTDLHVSYTSYVDDGKAYSVSMAKSGTAPIAIRNSTASGLSSESYTAVKYLGTKQYLVAKDEHDIYQLITPDMTQSSSPIALGAKKKLLSVTYPSYGSDIDGYLLYNYESEKVEKCNLTATTCNDIIEAGSRDFEGDIQGTTKSLFLVEGKLIAVDKTNGSTQELSLGGKEIASGHGTTSFQGGSFYFIATDKKLYRADLASKQIITITQTANENLERVRAFMTDWVICGSDTLLMAYKKDGSSTEPVILVENTMTTGYKYVTNFAIGNNYLFVKYGVDTQTSNTKYSACLFDGETSSCHEDSFWASIIASKNGTVNFESSYPYAPYAYVRVDDTDNYGGGKLKAIDPKHPLSDGITMGSIANYNFQTFLGNSRYFTETVDDEGSVVLYAKNDKNFHVDAFYMNLLQENSLVQLTDTEPAPDVTTGRDHCHGRHCMICHNLAGGKIYKDKEGSKSAYRYKIRLDFEDGTQTLADIAKGKGENFSLPLKHITGDFKAKVLDENNTVVNSSAGYLHQGVSYANCNYCHARDGQTRHDAPGAITISPIIE
jgi:hypothetical protein